MHTKAELLDLLRTHKIHLHQRRGQCYLIDPTMTRRLVASCGLTGADTVVEIGAGLGALTDELAAAAKRVIAVEIDSGVAQTLAGRVSHPDTIDVWNGDVLEFPWAEHAPVVVVGMIPYHITSPILVNLCEHRAHLRDVWLGMQREVAQRLCAGPGTKAYGRLGLFVQYAFAPDMKFTIPRTSFFPQPDVDSTWVHLAPRAAPPVAAADEPLLFDVIRAAFGQRRKMLANCLKEVETVRRRKLDPAGLLAAAKLPPRVRGEELTLADFARLADAIVR